MTRARRRWGLPLALQITALLIAGLVIAQLVTMALTMLLPPEPASRYRLEDIARTLEGASIYVRGARPLRRMTQATPPELGGPGWLASKHAQRELAGLLQLDEADVRLFFFTPLPFAGAARSIQPLDDPGPRSQPPGDFGTGGEMPATGYDETQGHGIEPRPPGPDRPPPPPPSMDGVPEDTGLGAAPLDPNIWVGPVSGATGTSGAAIRLRSPKEANGAPQTARGELGVPLETSAGEPATVKADTRDLAHGQRPSGDKHGHAPGQDASFPRMSIAHDLGGVELPPDAPRNPIGEPPRGLFAWVPPPRLVEGDFVAAMRLVKGGWAVVQPATEPFPNAWQRRILLWFFISVAMVAPVGWLFSRRVVRPIAGFATAAEKLGRDPGARILALEGPAEIGRAAHAFNRMQSRLRSFVEDRTAMIGAISHDLRTPLTRMRFRIEDVADEHREGLLHEVQEMEQMINSVLTFIRDASEPGSRETLDLCSLVEDVVEGAVFVGHDVRLERCESAFIEADAIGIRRVLDNLVANAVKYGEKACVRLFLSRQDAIIEISDEGPGLSDEELGRVFQPFYRSAEARASNKQGSGLGLAVCRSIARAHGGDVVLRRGSPGLIAQMRIPLTFSSAASLDTPE